MDPITVEWNIELLRFVDHVCGFSFQLHLSTNITPYDHWSLNPSFPFHRLFPLPSFYEASTSPVDLHLTWSFFDENLFCFRNILCMSLFFPLVVISNCQRNRLGISISWIDSLLERFLLPFSIPFS